MALKRSPLTRSSPMPRGKKPKAKRGTTTAAYRRKALTLWGQYVHARDVHCQLCGKGGGKLDAHHIIRKEVNATRTDEMNGVLLCAYPCHRTVMHGEPFKAVQFYNRFLGVEACAALNQKAYDGLHKKYPSSYWQAEIVRLTALLEETQWQR